MRFLLKFLLLFVSFLTMLDAALGTSEVLANKAGNFNQGALGGSTMSTQGIQYEGQPSQLDPSVLDTYRDIFGNSIYHLSQQQGAVILPFVQMEGMVATQKSINRLGALPNPSQYTSRGSTVQPSNPKSDVRWLIAERYWQACFVDNFDQIRTLWDIKNGYTVALANSFGRLYDRIIIRAALGPVCVGPTSVNNRPSVMLPDSQKRVAFNKDATGESGLNILTMRTVRRRMKRTFAINKGDILVWVVTANETDDLLGVDEITSRDYTTILTLMGGEVSAFLGFAFVETELLVHNESPISYNPANGQLGTGAAFTETVPANQGIRTFCFVQNSALCFGMNQNMFSRISELPRHHYNWQIYYATEIGAVRKEEVQVFEVITWDKDIV